jgi:transcriptional regulator with XRE-family HTH domain
MSLGVLFPQILIFKVITILAEPLCITISVGDYAFFVPMAIMIIPTETKKQIISQIKKKQIMEKMEAVLEEQVLFGKEQILFGKTITTFRNERNWNLSMLAEKAEIAVGYLSRLESNKQRPSLDVLESICKALDVPIQVLVLEATINQKSENPNVNDMRDALRPILRRITQKAFFDDNADIKIDLNTLMSN